LLQGANITSILQNNGYDITSISSEVLKSALNLILMAWGSPELPAGTALQQYTAVQQALVMRVTKAWTEATPPPLIDSLWNVSRQMPAPGVDMGVVPSLLSRLERDWMANEIAWDAVERALRQDFHEGVADQTTGLVQFLERKGWTVKRGPNGCIYRPDPLPSGVLWGEGVAECPLPTPTKGGGKPITGKVTATKIPKAYKAFEAIFTSYYQGLSGQSANTVAVGMGKRIGKIGINGGQRLPAQTGGFDQDDPDTDPTFGSDEILELYDRMEKVMSAAAAGGAAWEKWDPDRREETFSYYTPAMLYWINKGVRLYHGYWYPENTNYDFSLQEVINIRSFRVMRSGNDRVLITQLLNECKSALANLVGEVADHLLETYNDIFVNTPTLVEASLASQWENMGQTLIDTVKAMWVANINKASAADLFGAQTCGGEGNNKQSGVLHRFNHLVFAPTATLFMKFSTSDKVSDEDRKHFIRDLKSTPMEAADKTPSQSLKNFINELLRQQCMQLNSQIIGTDGVPKSKPSEGKGLLWWREWFCINKVANWSGSIGAIDTALLKSFKVGATTDKKPGKGATWNPRVLVDVPLATDSSSTLAIVNKVLTWNVPDGTAIGVTNNAMMTRIPVKGDYIVAQLTNTTGGASTRFVKDCPVEAVMDGMGTFGDCYKGLNAPNYHCSDLKVVIEQPYGDGKAPQDNAHEVWGGTNGDTPLRFYFSMDVACGSGGKVAVTYDLQYSNQDRAGSGLGDSEPGSYQSPYLFYTAKIGTGKVDILEANTLLRHALTAIKNQAYAFSVAADGTPNQGLSGAKSWSELFQTPYRVTIAKDGKDKANTFGYYVMTQFLGDKYMGDFGQGLYVLADQAYPPNLLDWAQYRVAADGDRPSYVRNSVIALEAIDGVSANSKLFYADSLGDLVSGTFVRSNPWGQIPGISASGGGGRRTRRRRQRPRKTRRKGQKTKNKKTRIRKRRGKKPTRERNARRRAKTNKRFVFRK
ncbi:MAG: PH domain-containing protein, partial [Planctomycetota bacterium]